MNLNDFNHEMAGDNNMFERDRDEVRSNDNEATNQKGILQMQAEDKKENEVLLQQNNTDDVPEWLKKDLEDADFIPMAAGGRTNPKEDQIKVILLCFAQKSE
jgi:hypothetical protein